MQTHRIVTDKAKAPVPRAGGAPFRRSSSERGRGDDRGRGRRLPTRRASRQSPSRWWWITARVHSRRDYGIWSSQQNSAWTRRVDSRRCGGEPEVDASEPSTNSIRPM